MNLSYVLNSLRTWRWYRYFMVFQLVVILAIISVEVYYYGKYFDRTVIILLESFITFAFFVEVILRAIFCWATFHKNLGSMIDLFSLLLILCLFFGLLSTSARNCGFECTQILPMALLGVRYGIQFFRILFDLARCRAVRKAANLDFELDTSYDYCESI